MFKKILKVLGLLVLLLVVGIGGLAAWVALSDLPQYERKSIASQLYTDSVHLDLGRKIVTERCAYCHLGEDGKLSGRLFYKGDEMFTELWSGNITKSAKHGIANYSDGELAYLLRTGIKRDGYFAGPYMSSPIQSDEELNCIISYLRSENDFVAASEHAPPAHKAGFFEKAIQKLGLFAPIAYDGTAVPSISPNDTLRFGKYLVQARYECYGCHSQSFETLNPYKPEDSPGYLGGGNEIVGHDFSLTPSANISPSMSHGIGSWTYEQFERAVLSGETPSGKVLSNTMPRIIGTSPEERRAMWLYLKTVPAIDVPVKRK